MPRDCDVRSRQVGVKKDPAQGATYLQNDPVTFLRSEIQCGLSHHLLSLPQRYVVEVPIVEGVSEFFT